MPKIWPASKDFGERLNRARRAAKLSGAELARRAGVSQSLVSHVETGRNGISDDVLQRIAAIIGVDIADLVGTQGAVTWIEVPPEVLAKRRTLRQEEWPLAYQGSGPEYWPGTLRDFVGSLEAAQVRLVPDEVPLLAKAALEDDAPIDNTDWVRVLSSLRLMLGIQGRPILLEAQPITKQEDEPPNDEG